MGEIRKKQVEKTSEKPRSPRESNPTKHPTGAAVSSRKCFFTPHQRSSIVFLLELQEQGGVGARRQRGAPARGASPEEMPRRCSAAAVDTGVRASGSRVLPVLRHRCAPDAVSRAPSVRQVVGLRQGVQPHSGGVSSVPPPRGGGTELLQDVTLPLLRIRHHPIRRPARLLPAARRSRRNRPDHRILVSKFGLQMLGRRPNHA